MTPTDNGHDAGKTFEMVRRVWQSALSRTHKAVLQVLLAYARPDLTVYHSVDELAWACGYSGPTIQAALSALKRAKILRVEPGRGHCPGRATEYQIDLTHLPPRPLHPRQHHLTPARQTESHLRFETDNDLRFAAQTENSSRQTENHLPPISIRETTKKKNFLAHAPDKPKPQPTPTPDHLELDADFLTWFAAKVPELDLDAERQAFLGYCRRHAIVNVSWVGAFQDWLLNAWERWLKGEPTATTARQIRAAATPAAATRTTCSWADCDRPPCGHKGQACWDHGCCEVCDPTLRAANEAYDEWMAAGEVGKATAEPTTTLAPAEPTASPAAVVDDTTAVVHPVTPVISEPEEAIPVSAVAALASAFAGSHTLAPANPRAGPVGRPPPPRLALKTILRDEGAALEKDVDYLARMRARKAELRAQLAALQPAMAAD